MLQEALRAATMETDASLAEINPLILDRRRQRRSALDAKFNFDSNALFRHPEIVAMRDLDEEDPAEIEASQVRPLLHLARRQHRLPRQRRRPRDGDDGHDQAATAASRRTSSTSAAARRPRRSPRRSRSCSRNPKVKAILVNIFGGIMRCDTIAEGVIAASQGGQAQGAAGRAHEGHQRGARQEDARRVGPADHQRRQHGRGGAEGRRRAPRQA